MGHHRAPPVSIAPIIEPTMYERMFTDDNVRTLKLVGKWSLVVVTAASICYLVYNRKAVYKTYLKCKESWKNRHKEPREQILTFSGHKIVIQTSKENLFDIKIQGPRGEVKYSYPVNPSPLSLSIPSSSSSVSDSGKLSPKGNKHEEGKESPPTET